MKSDKKKMQFDFSKDAVSRLDTLVETTESSSRAEVIRKMRCKEGAGDARAASAGKETIPNLGSRSFFSVRSISKEGSSGYKIWDRSWRREME